MHTCHPNTWEAEVGVSGTQQEKTKTTIFGIIIIAYGY